MEKEEEGKERKAANGKGVRRDNLKSVECSD